jgi:hypothetical protein
MKLTKEEAAAVETLVNGGLKVESANGVAIQQSGGMYFITTLYYSEKSYDTFEAALKIFKRKAV